MKVFDFNIHLPTLVAGDVNNVIDEDLTLSGSGLLDGLIHHYNDLKGLDGLNVLLFNQNLFHQEKTIAPFVQELKKRYDNHLLTCLVNFRDKNVNSYLEKSLKEGVHAFMFNSYLQKIRRSDFEDVLNVCRFAEENNRMICIDGSYGTSKMYEYDNMLLACFVADHITKVPIVIIHSGGYRIIESMLLALDKPNVMLDTSFSLNYYIGSSLEQDYAFAYKKLGCDRVLFGSDNPYVKLAEVKEQQLTFFLKYGFSTAEIESIFYENATRLMRDHGR